VDQQALTVAQFGSRAANYLASSVHATGADLVRLTAIADRQRPARVLDLGCGAGHVSMALARGGAQRITALDPSAEMLAVVAREAEVLGVRAIETCLAGAEDLPFERGTFDFVVTRYSAHHWASVPRALAECARVIASNGRLIVIDVVAPERPLFDTSLQVIEFLRDASHVRDYRLSEWRRMQMEAGFAEPAVDIWKLPLDFESWTARIGTPAARIAALEAVFAELPGEVREYFQISPQLSFVTDSAWIEARRFDAD
jgi:ubiquinone/menaquinone biosynthesis C-methylase UbiE